MIKVILDQGLPRTAAVILRARGWDVVHVGEVKLSDATDMQILQFAYAHERTVVTLDADFHALLMVDRRKSPSVIRLRFEGLKGEELAEILQGILNEVSDDLAQGAMVTVNRNAIRVHRLR